MVPGAIAELIKERFSLEVKGITEFRGQVSVTVGKGRIVEILQFLHDTPELSFDYLEDLCGMDYLGRPKGKVEPRFEVVYHLYSMEHRHRIRIKAEVPESDCVIDSVVDIWEGANWHERECLDMFGIVFNGHPDLRRILMPEDWEGYPLRKDYPVEGTEKKWRGFVEVLDKAERFKQFEWKG